MADDAPAPTYANNPADATTWSPAYAAEMQAQASAYAAQQQLAAKAATLAELQPCAFAAGPTWSTQATALKALAQAYDSGDADPLFVAMARSTATAMASFGAEFTRRFNAAGGTAPTT